MRRIATVIAPVALVVTIVTISVSAAATPLPQRLLAAGAIAGYAPAAPAPKTLNLTGYASKVGLDPKAKNKLAATGFVAAAIETLHGPAPIPAIAGPSQSSQTSKAPDLCPGPELPSLGHPHLPRRSLQGTPHRRAPDPNRPRSPRSPHRGHQPQRSHRRIRRALRPRPRHVRARHFHPRPSTLTRKLQAGRQPLLPASVAPHGSRNGSFFISALRCQHLIGLKCENPLKERVLAQAL